MALFVRWILKKRAYKFLKIITGWKPGYGYMAGNLKVGNLKMII